MSRYRRTKVVPCRFGRGAAIRGRVMIDLYYAPTPNGWKISIMLEELGLPYNVIALNIRAASSSNWSFWRSARTTGFRPSWIMKPADGGEPFSAFETGAIPIYLADKTGRFLPQEMRARSRTIQWLMWQM